MNNKKLSLLKLATLISMSFSLPSFAEIQIIHAGTLLVSSEKSPLKNHTMVIENGKVSNIKKGFIPLTKFSEDATLIDLSEQFVMAGLIDMHVHLQGELGPQNDRDTLRKSGGDTLIKSVHFAKKTLMAGFTTVRDLGGSAEYSFALRDGINSGYVQGPRIIAAGTNVSVTGGHGDVDGMSPDLLDFYTAKTICDGPYDCRRATRHAIKYGADVIKITSTGGVLSDTNTGTGQQMADDELKEVVDAAHALGRKVASHAHAATGINAALRAGVDSIEHGSYANEESIKLFKKSGAYLVPTLLAGDTVVNLAKTSDFMSPAIKSKAIRVGGDMIENFKRSVKAGVNIAYGTDSGVSKHGENAKEAVLMYKAGMATKAILTSATINAAELAGLSDEIGTLSEGKVADVIAMKVNPLEDITALLDINFVMKSGEVVKHN